MMSKSYEIQGLIHSIGETTEYGSNGFTKREFVIKLTGEGENSSYPNHVALELIKDKCAMMDAYNTGDEIKAQFSLSGRLWSGGGKPEKCFTSLQAWKVDPVSSSAEGPEQTMQSAFDSARHIPSDYDDDIPF